MKTPERSVNWIVDYESGLQKSRNENKPVFLDFFKGG